MFFCGAIFVITSLNFVRDIHAVPCDQNCADKPVFTPSTLVVRYGDPASVRCSVCQRDCHNNYFNLEFAVGDARMNGTNISWTADSVTEWELSLQCFYSNATDYQCCTYLPFALYKPPSKVSFTFGSHTEQVHENLVYNLTCTVHDVAPVQNVSVTFFRGGIELGRRSPREYKEKKQLTTEVHFSRSFKKEDDGAEFWCEAKLDLGPEGPQPPLVWMSPKITPTVFYKPQLHDSPHPESITISEGKRLQLNCSAVGNPSPMYKWILPSDSLTTPSGDILIIESVSVEDKGKYTCNVSNFGGFVTKEFTVVVEVSYTGIIILLVFIALVVLVIGAACIIFRYYAHNRMGQYNLKDVFRLHARHSAVPTIE